MRSIKFKKNTLFFFGVLFCLFLVFYFSWTPSGKLNEDIPLPLALISWYNTYYNLRTAVPFVLIAYLLAYFLSAWKIILSCFFVVALAEIGQMFIPNRSADYIDVLYGCFGALLGISLRRIILITVRSCKR